MKPHPLDPETHSTLAKRLIVLSGLQGDQEAARQYIEILNLLEGDAKERRLSSRWGEVKKDDKPWITIESPPVHNAWFSPKFLQPPPAVNVFTNSSYADKRSRGPNGRFVVHAVLDNSSGRDAQGQSVQLDMEEVARSHFLAPLLSRLDNFIEVPSVWRSALGHEWFAVRRFIVTESSAPQILSFPAVNVWPKINLEKERTCATSSS